MICNILSSYDFRAASIRRCDLYRNNSKRRKTKIKCDKNDFNCAGFSQTRNDYLLNFSMSNDNDKKQSHPYTCSCNDCVRKYGNLPLLVQVIEGREKAQESTNKYSKPSTSEDFHSEASTSKSISCSYCNKTFSHRGDFNKHIRTHTGEQPYECSVCHRKFAHTSNLNRHIRVHTGDRPYLCDICNKNFNRKDKLDMHKKTKLCKNTSERNASSSK